MADSASGIAEAPARLRQRTNLVAAAILAVAVLTAGWMLRRGGTSAVAGVQREANVMHLEPFVINLADSDRRSYLRVGVDLQIAGGMREDEQPAVTARVRDTILGVLSQHDSDEIFRGDGKIRLKRELAGALQQRLPELQVQEVYFTDFLIQR